ncbi:hypothetical protein LPJ63_002205 [Coemansia sp. RSA 2711]|nr:hypothetical protein LPJ63_002205 [Coemansia sp. RSA 2711]
MAGILDYAYTAVKALLEVFLIGLSGYIFARNGTLNKATLKSLSVISINLLTPALMFSKMTETLDPRLLVELWNEPVFYFVYGGAGLVWSRVGSRVLGLDGDYARLCDVATFFSNTNTLPVSLIKSIALSSGSQFLLRDADDTPLKVAARGVSYAMIFATLNNILRWSFGVALLGGLGAGRSRSAFNSVATTPRTPAPTRAGSRAPNDELTPLVLGDAVLFREPTRRARVAAALRGAWAAARACVTPPVYAIAAAFVVITVQPLHRAVMDPRTVLYTLWSAIDMCGDACVPLILISLGGQLGVMARDKHRRRRAADGADDDDGSEGATRAPSSAQLGDLATCAVPSIVLRTATESGGAALELGRAPTDPLQPIVLPQRQQRRGVALVLAGRFVAVPTLAIALITTLRVAFPGLVPLLAQDPVYVLTLLILSSTPPAINLITVAQATGQFEAEAAQMLFYGYVLGILVLAVEVSGFLWLTSVLAAI